MTRYLLDTNVVSDLVRHPSGRVAAHINRVGEANVCTSLIVAAELHFGAAKKGSAALTARIDAVLGALQVLPLEAPTDRNYGYIRAGLERAGKVIGANDLLIAAHAMTLGHTLVTDSIDEFSGIGKLRLENWLRV